MVSIPENESNVQSLQDRINELRRSEYRYELRINQYEEEIKWQNELDSDANLSAAHKLVLRQVRQIIKKVRYDLEEPVHIYISEIVNRTGLGEKSVRRLLTELAEYKLINKETKRIRKGGEIRNELWISLGHKIIHNAGLIQIPPRNHGGSRKCEKCGSENINVYVAYECRHCGHIHQADITQLGE